MKFIKKMAGISDYTVHKAIPLILIKFHDIPFRVQRFTMMVAININTNKQKTQVCATSCLLKNSLFNIIVTRSVYIVISACTGIVFRYPKNIGKTIPFSPVPLGTVETINFWLGTGWVAIFCQPLVSDYSHNGILTARNKPHHHLVSWYLV